MNLLFLLVSIIATAFLSLTIDASSVGQNWIFQYGQYLIAAEFLVFAFLLYKARHAVWLDRQPISTTSLVILALIILFTVSREPLEFKISYDEQALSVTAMNMHFNRQIAYPDAGYEINGRYELLGNSLNKRPAFFPFLVSLIHDISGYRINNVFYLNLFLTGLTVLLLFLISRVIADEYSALLVVSLFSITPLVSQNASGGGFEILNITMLLLCLWISIQYLKKPDTTLMLTLWFSVLLLAQTRYESILFVPFAALVILLGLRVKGIHSLPAPVMLMPLLLVPPVIHLKANINDKETWQVAEHEISTFSTDYLVQNIGAGVEYLFSFSPYSSNNPLLAVTGVIAIVIFAVRLPRLINNASTHNKASLIAVAIFMFAIICHFCLILVYHDGNLNNTETHRYALPLFIALSIALSFVLKGNLNSLGGKSAAVIPLLISAYVFSFPASAKQTPTNSSIVQKRVNWILDYFDSLPERDYILLIHDPWDFILHKIPASSLQTVSELADKTTYHLNKGTYHQILIVQDYFVDPKTGSRRYADTDFLDQRFSLQEVSNIQLAPFRHSSLSVIESVNLSLSPVKTANDKTYDRNRLPAIDSRSYAEWIKNLFEK